MNWRDADARGPVPNSVSAGRATSLPCIIIIRWPQPVTATAAVTARAATNAVRIFMTSSSVSGLCEAVAVFRPRCLKVAGRGVPRIERDGRSS